MLELLKSKTVKARKPHRCSTCRSIAVQPRQSYTRDTYIYDGQMYDWVNCDDCSRLADDVWEWAGSFDRDEGLSHEDYAEWAMEFKDDPTHGKAARAFLARGSAGAAPEGEQSEQGAAR